MNGCKRAPDGRLFALRDDKTEAMGRIAPPLSAVPRGFTLVELIVILAIIGVLAAYVSSRFFSANQYQARAYFDQVVTAARYAQKIAMASGCPVKVVFSGNNYTLTQQASPCTSVPCSVSAAYPPITQSAVGVPVSGAPGSSGIALTSGSFCFDGQGLVSDPTLSTAAYTVTGGGFSMAFTLNVPSGYVSTP